MQFEIYGSGEAERETYDQMDEVSGNQIFGLGRRRALFIPEEEMMSEDMS